MDTKKSNIFSINSEQTGQRLDNFLIKKLKGIPKSLIYKIIRSGQVRVNKGRTKASYRLKNCDIIRIPPYLLSEDRAASNILNDVGTFIEYENNDFILINKPSGIAVHSGTNQSVDFLSSLKTALSMNELSLVHRLDKSTSGCLLVSKNYQSASYLGKRFSQRDIKKKYFALLTGRLEKDTVEVESRIHKDTFQKKMNSSAVIGKDAYTKITLLKSFRSYSYVEVEIETGRTHQIRTHAASIGHPVAGDNKYGTKVYKSQNKLINLRRLFLHSYYLSFYYNKEYEFVLDLPCELKEVLSILEKENE